MVPLSEFSHCDNAVPHLDCALRRDNGHIYGNARTTHVSAAASTGVRGHGGGGGRALRLLAHLLAVHTISARSLFLPMLSEW